MLTKWKVLVGNQYTILKLKPGDKEYQKEMGLLSGNL